MVRIGKFRKIIIMLKDLAEKDVLNANGSITHIIPAENA